MTRIALEFTEVLYNPDDVLSFVLAILSLTPQAILMVYASLVLSRREAETILMFGGQLGCEIINLYLKQIIKQERPTLYYATPLIGSNGYGMPSAHSQFMAYYATYICLWMFFRVKNFSTRKKASRAIFLLALAGSVCYSRVYLYYHTPIQVAAGIIAGVVIGIGWFIAVILVRDLGIVDLFLDTWPARFFYIKDTAGERASFVRDEYAEWRRMRMKLKLLIKAD